MNLPEDTLRLKFSPVVADDAAYILSLVNSPGWLQFIGDRNIADLYDARAYIATSFEASYVKNGFGIWLLRAIETGKPVGTCGLVKRDYLEGIDIGFAFSPAFCGYGYGFEAAESVVSFAKEKLGLTQLFAIVMEENVISIRLLEKLGFRDNGVLVIPSPEPENREELKLYKLPLN